MSSPPPSKRQRHSPPSAVSTTTADASVTASQPLLPPITPTLNTNPPPPSTSPTTPNNPRKRRLSRSPKLDTRPPGAPQLSGSPAAVSIPSLLQESSEKKRGRTNTPWTAAEEQRLKQMRDAGNSWGEIAKAFPNRTEGSVKKHWYKDMHYAEFAEDESVALREAIKEYEANKWKAIGLKLGKPAKACEQYAREHFKNL